MNLSETRKLIGVVHDNDSMTKNRCVNAAGDAIELGDYRYESAGADRPPTRFGAYARSRQGAILGNSSIPGAASAAQTRK